MGVTANLLIFKLQKENSKYFFLNFNTIITVMKQKMYDFSVLNMP